MRSPVSLARVVSLTLIPSQRLQVSYLVKCFVNRCVDGQVICSTDPADQMSAVPGCFWQGSLNQVVPSGPQVPRVGIFSTEIWMFRTLYC